MQAETLDLRKLKAFQLTAKHCRLRAAAERLGLTVPAISFQIRRLEQELEVELFQRAPAGLVLTPAGEELLNEANAIFERVENALLKVGSRDMLKGRLSLSTGSDIVGHFAPRISSFLRRYPGVLLRHRVYNSVQTLQLVRNGDIDVGIGHFPRLPANLDKRLVAESALSLLSPPAHPAGRRRSMPLDELARHRLILPPAQSSTRKIIDQVFAKARVKVRDAIEVGSCHTARDLAANGVGVAIVHSLCVASGSGNHLRALERAEFGQVAFSIAYRRDAAQSVLLRGLIEHLARPEEG